MRSKVLYIAVWSASLVALLTAALLGVMTEELGASLALVAAGGIGALVSTHLKFRQLGKSVQAHSRRLLASSSTHPVPDVVARCQTSPEDIGTAVEQATLRALTSHDSLLFAELASVRDRLRILEASAAIPPGESGE